MAAPKTAKLFSNGRSQAVRLPREFRFPGKEVAIRRDETTGDVILSPMEETPKMTLRELFALFDSLQIPADQFERNVQMPAERDIFE